jgi:hypothetical protein
VLRRHELVGVVDDESGRCDDRGIPDEPSSGGPRRTLLAVGALVGAAAVGLAWLVLGNGGEGSVQTSLASLGQAPGIAPPAYAYLDNASVALYLGQLEGGIAKSQQLTQQLTQGRNAGLSAGGLSLGGSTGSSSSAERVVTPTATARFYQLLDLLGRDGYLHTINEAGAPAEIRRAFSGVAEGSFVKLAGCTLRMPSYVRLEQISRASKGTESPLDVYLAAVGSSASAGRATTGDEVTAALMQAGRVKSAVGSDMVQTSAQSLRRLDRAIRTLHKSLGSNPRVPLSTCNGKTDYQPRGVDVLIPIRLGSVSSEQSLLAGPVTVVGKLVRAVRKPGQEYVDEPSIATFSGPTAKVDASQVGGDRGLGDELTADAVVLAPGAVILPIAIYK